MGRFPKPKEKRQGRHNPREDLQLIDVGNVEIPEFPEGVNEDLRESWEEYWRSPLAQATDTTNKLKVVTRLWQLYDLRDKHYLAYRNNPLVKGSTGQPVVNPLGKQMQALDSQILQIEDRIGLNPKAQIHLGVQWAQGQNQLMDLADRTFKARGPIDEDDPRGLLEIK